jgi:D-alanyl-D-alanine dipeptidase
MVRSKTQKTKSRSELKMLMKAAVLKGEVSGWWHTHH